MNVTKLSSSPQAYHPVTRWLHAGLVLGVLFQLMCAALMTHPEHDDGDHGVVMAVHSEESAKVVHHQDVIGTWFMRAHRTAGFVVVLIVMANLIWAIVLRGKPRKRQISVLFSVHHWREAKAVVRQLYLVVVRGGSLPAPGNALSLIVEMLGMLTMAAMAVSGAIIWNLWSGPESIVIESVEVWMGIHAAIAILLFLYLAGHISMALLHMFSGDRVFARIFPIRLKE